MRFYLVMNDLREQAQDAWRSGDKDAALSLARQALAAAAPDAKPTPRLAWFYCSLAMLFEPLAHYQEAEECARKALAVIDSLMPDRGGAHGALVQLRALGALGTALRQRGRYKDAEAPLVRAIEIAESLPEKPMEAAIAWNNLGMICKYVGWFERGETAYQKALAAAESEPAMKATVLHNIGGLYHSWGRFAQGEAPAREAWEIRRQLRGEDHPETLADAVAYAGVLDGLKRWQESRPIYERALVTYRYRFGAEHFEVASTLHNLAMLEAAEGHRTKAIALARETYEMKVRLLGQNHPETALSAMNLAVLQGAAEVESRRLLEGALRVFEQTLQPGHARILRIRKLLSA